MTIWTHTSVAKQSFIVNNHFHATAIHLCSPCSDWSQNALKHEVERTRLLREKIFQATISEYPEKITQILTLFGCTVLTGCIAEARPHATPLCRLVDIAVKHGTVGTVRLCFAWCRARDLGAMFLVRSSFDVDVWVPELITPIYASHREAPSAPLRDPLTEAG